MEKLKKKDLCLIGGLFLASLILFLLLRVLSSEGAFLSVVCDGKETARYPLTQDLETDISTSYGTNHLSIRNGTARVTHADCPDGLCTRMPAVSREGESIICLPHRLVFTVVGGEEAYDGVVR